MSSSDDDREWTFPSYLQPEADQFAGDLQAVLDAVVTVSAEVPEDAYTAPILGTVRSGNGAVIEASGLVLTIGYLILEAHTVWLTTNRGAAVAGHPLAYDHVSGFGLVQALGPLAVPALPRGSASGLARGDDVLVVGQGGMAHALKATILDRHEFAGAWEYLLEDALFTVPAHPQWGGAALVDFEGRLLGIGSLLLQETVGEKSVQCNMMVPIDILAPVFETLVSTGASGLPPRPWLGMFTNETEDGLIVGGLADAGPAAIAGAAPGDRVMEVAGYPVDTLASMLRAVWSEGPAGSPVMLTVERGGELLSLRVLSADRGAFLKKPSVH